jgi:hypothetical protein
MKTMVTFKQNLLKSALFILVSALSLAANAGTTPASTTPAKPTSFTAMVNNNNTNRVDLKWSTETETNLSHFIVERSTDGTTYSNAALVFAYGNTNAKSDYAFADNISKVQTGTVYYRISSIANDGGNQASDIRIIRIEK